MRMYAKVRRLFFRERLSINEIQRRTSLSRNTIKKWLKEEEGVEPHYVRIKADSKITPFVSYIELALQADSHRPKRDRRTGLKLFTELQKEGFTGSYSCVNRFIHQHRDQAAKVTGKSAFVPLKFQLGEAFQFDWSEELLVIGASTGSSWSPTPNSVPVARSGSQPIPPKAMKCCLTPIPAPLPRWAASNDGVSTTI